MSDLFHFPENFMWGAATSSYQIEGAVNEDGRKESIWDVFSHTPGKTANGETGDVADDHYHLWKQDVALMKEMGLKAYRFSLAWPRILPDGKGKVNQAGIDFYSRLIDELLNADIHPMGTLYHWDLPAALVDGWLNRDTAYAFEEYAGVAARAFGDRVKEWVTINEPFCASFLSFKFGHHAPGLKDPYKALAAAHHLLLAHGLAVPVIRAGCLTARVGIVLNEGPFYPLSEAEVDRRAARNGDGELNRWFLDPIYGRHYPSDMLLDYVKQGILPSISPDFIHEGDMERIMTPTDFLGINYYTRNLVSANRAFGSRSSRASADMERTDMDWEVYPYGLYETICRAYFAYKPNEIIITENGASYRDGPDQKGRIHDERRIAYLQSHIAAVAKAIQAGAPVTGYYVWSLLDNFEWAFGYAQRFGLIYVDYDTLKRYSKDSAHWYRRVIRENGLQIS